MSGIVGSLNTRGSGLINAGSASDGQVFTGTGAGLPVGFEAAAGGGKVLKVTYLVHQATVTSTSASYTTFTSKAITLEASDSLLLIHWTLYCGIASDTAGAVRVFRDSTDLVGTFGGNSGSGSIVNTMGSISAFAGHAGATYQPQNMSGSILDTPGGNVTYNFKVATTVAGTVYLNRASYATDNGYTSRPASYASFIEIAA